MPRLFVAVDLPDETKDSLSALCSGVSGAKWVRREQMHLTLRFIGDANEEQFAAIQTALGSIQASAFKMRLEAVGQFPPKGKPRILWVGVKAPSALTELQRQINSSLNTLGLPPEDHPFSAHITLARLKTPPPPESTRQYFARHAAFKTDSFPVGEFILFSSLLAPQGSTYRKEAMYPLSAEP